MAIPLTNQLSDRELQVLECISHGEKINDIAIKLFLSPHTIISHRRSLLRKLQAKNGADLIRIAFQRGHLKLNSQTQYLKHAS